MSRGQDERRVDLDAAAPTDVAATKRVGIIGAGKLGMTLARAAVAAGYEVAVASSGPAERIALSVDVLAPGTVASTVQDVADSADVIVLAVPVHRFRELPGDIFDGKILVDAMNYWPDTDGERSRAGGSRRWLERRRACTLPGCQSRQEPQSARLPRAR